jgi:hypothetical protein
MIAGESENLVRLVKTSLKRYLDEKRETFACCCVVLKEKQNVLESV